MGQTHTHGEAPPKRCLLILDINGILLSRWTTNDKGERIKRRDPVMNPLCKPFLERANFYFFVAFWTAADPDETDKDLHMIKELVPDLKPFFVWNKTHCLENGMSHEVPGKPLFLKPLWKVWKEYPLFDKTTTVLMEHSIEKVSTNPAKNCLIVNPFDPDNSSAPNPLAGRIFYKLNIMSVPRRMRKTIKSLGKLHTYHRKKPKIAEQLRDQEIRRPGEEMMTIILAHIGGHPLFSQLPMEFLRNRLWKELFAGCRPCSICGTYTLNYKKADESPNCGRHYKPCDMCDRITGERRDHRPYCGCSCGYCGRKAIRVGPTGVLICDNCPNMPTCFHPKCVVEIQRPGVSESVKVEMFRLAEGDMLYTGQTNGEDGSRLFRRVLRIWKIPLVAGSVLSFVRLNPECAVTRYHLVWNYHTQNWATAGSLADRFGNETQFVKFDEVVDFVYDLELDGHEDTVDIGGYLCGTIGAFATHSRWNWSKSLESRKTRHCISSPQCSICDVICEPKLDLMHSRLVRCQYKTEQVFQPAPQALIERRPKIGTIEASETKHMCT